MMCYGKVARLEKQERLRLGKISELDSKGCIEPEPKLLRYPNRSKKFISEELNPTPTESKY